MNFEQLRIFISVADCKSFTKAAESLYISHSTTSRNVAGLEDELGVKLLSRDNRSVRLTAAGEILYAEGARLLERIDAIENAVRSAGRGHAGGLSIASVNLYTYELLRGYKDFCKKYPDVVLAMHYRDISEIWRQVASGEADVGVTFSYTLPKEPNDFEVHIVASERFCVITPPEHPLAQKCSVKLSEIRDMRCITVATPKFDFLKALGERCEGDFGLIPNDSVVAPTVESLFLQVSMGNGVSLAPLPLAKEYGAGCAVLDLEDIDASFDVVMLWRRDNLNPSLPLFAETMLTGPRRAALKEKKI